MTSPFRDVLAGRKRHRSRHASGGGERRSRHDDYDTDESSEYGAVRYPEPPEVPAPSPVPGGKSQSSPKSYNARVPAGLAMRQNTVHAYGRRVGMSSDVASQQETDVRSSPDGRQLMSAVSQNNRYELEELAEEDDGHERTHSTRQDVQALADRQGRNDVSNGFSNDDNRSSDVIRSNDVIKSNDANRSDNINRSNDDLRSNDVCPKQPDLTLHNDNTMCNDDNLGLRHDVRQRMNVLPPLIGRHNISRTTDKYEFSDKETFTRFSSGEHRSVINDNDVAFNDANRSDKQDRHVTKLNLPDDSDITDESEEELGAILNHSTNSQLSEREARQTDILNQSTNSQLSHKSTSDASRSPHLHPDRDENNRIRTSGSERRSPATTKSGNKTRRLSSLAAAMFPSPRVAAAPPRDPSLPPPYSAGEVTARTPSPSSFMWHPVKPGYQLEPPPTMPRRDQIVIRRMVQIHSGTVSSGTPASPGGQTSDSEVGLKQSIPAMPLVCAVVCFFFNAVLPGFGTVLAGLSVFVCSRPRPHDASRSTALCANCLVGLLQLLTTPLLLIGWIWSIVWGLAFVHISGEYYPAHASVADGTASSDSDLVTASTVLSSTPASSSSVTTVTSPGVTTTMSPGVTTMTSSGVTTMTSTTTVSIPGGGVGSSTHQDDPTSFDCHPIIVLQEAPVILQPAPPSGVGQGAAGRYPSVWPATGAGSGAMAWDANRSSDSPVMTASTLAARRHHHHRRRHQRRQSELIGQQSVNGRSSAAGAGMGSEAIRAGRLPSILLSTEALEQIVIHSSIVPEADHAAVDRKGESAAGTNSVVVTGGRSGGGVQARGMAQGPTSSLVSVVGASTSNSRLV